jgi:hypothetical protein
VNWNSGSAVGRFVVVPRRFGDFGPVFGRLRRWFMRFCMVFAVKNFCRRRSGSFFSAQNEVGRYHRTIGAGFPISRRPLPERDFYEGRQCAKQTERQPRIFEET